MCLVFDRDRFDFGLAASDCFGFGVAASSFPAGVGTPVGRIASGCKVWPTALKARATMQKHKVEPHADFMGGKLAANLSSVQAHRYRIARVILPSVE